MVSRSRLSLLTRSAAGCVVKLERLIPNREVLGYRHGTQGKFVYSYSFYDHK